MSLPSAWYSARPLLLAFVLLMQTAVGVADDSLPLPSWNGTWSAATSDTAPTAIHQQSIELICLTEQPFIIEGETAVLQAWLTTSDGHLTNIPFQFAWKVDAGRVENQALTTQWDLSAVEIGSQEVRKVTATGEAAYPGQNEFHCAVDVLIGRNVQRHVLRGADRFTARSYLLPNEAEAPGYGLYSYLLFSSPPKDAEERARYLKTIEACLLLLQKVDEYLSRYVRPASLNTTYIPVKEVPEEAAADAERAANVLAVYDYTAAQILLGKVNEVNEKGPYLLSVLAPLSAPVRS